MTNEPKRKMGRPALPPHMVKKLVTVSLPDYMVKFLQTVGNTSHYIEAAIAQKIARDNEQKD